jgi:Bacterial regulatory proteins, gntR family
VITVRVAKDRGVVESCIEFAAGIGEWPLNLPAALNLVEPLDRQTLGERAYAQLADLLISGRLAPGEKLSLRSAADVLGVSIMPVREAVSACP